MIIHCTQKLAAKLPGVSAGPLEETSPLGSWHGHLFTIDRRQCVFFCHDATRYALFMAGLRKEHFADLGRWHRELFLATLVAQGATEAQVARVALMLGPVRFDTATDRSVLGSLRVLRSDFDGALQFTANVLEIDPVAVSVELSHRPAQIGKVWIWPDQLMRERVAALG